MSTADYAHSKPPARRPGQDVRHLVTRAAQQQVRSDSRRNVRVKRRDLAFLFRNLAALTSNGLALPEAIGTLAQERSLRRYKAMFEDILHRVAVGDTFSSALANHPQAFDRIIAHQVQAGERAGTLPASLQRIAKQLEQASRVRAEVLRRLAYPVLLVVLGAVAVTFMLVFVIPLFEQLYAEAKVPLPLLTRMLIALGRCVVRYGWVLPVLAVAAVVGFRQARKRPETALAIDHAILRLPLMGNWFRNLSVLQFMEVFANLLESGFHLVEALKESAGAVRNRSLRRSIRALEAAVSRGERFGRELTERGQLFSPIVSQLIAVGERTGNLTKAASEIREHLRDEVRRQTDIFVGMIEPVLTILLAATIATILLAVYLPIFDMIGAVKG